MQRNLSWLSMLKTARVAVLVVVLTGVAFSVPQTADMLTEISDHSALAPALGFHLSLFLMAFFAWYWSRAALSARFDIDDTAAARSQGIQARLARDLNAQIDEQPFRQVPRYLFIGTALVGVLAAFRSDDVTDAVVILVWSAVFFRILEHRLLIKDILVNRAAFRFLQPRSADQAEPAPPVPSVWPAFLLLIRRAPFGRGFAIAILVLALLLYVVSGIASFFPSSPLWLRIVTVLGGVFPGPSSALLCLGLAIGPLTVLTFVADRRTWTIDLYGFHILLREIPVLVLLFVVMGLTTQLVSLHDVRIVSAGGPYRAPAQRQSLSAYFARWVTECGAGETRDGVRTVRPIIVAVSGGASRAGMWAARVLTEVDSIAAANKTTSIFAVSSVSGGSVGAAAYVAALRRDGTNGCWLSWPGHGRGKLDFMRDALRADALGPTMVGALLGDGQRAILGVPAKLVRSISAAFGVGGESRFRGGDRAEALERAFEANWSDATRGLAARPVSFADPYLSLFYDPPTGRGILTAVHFTPMWLANGTDAQNGDRVLTAPFRFTATQFPATRDALVLLKRDIPVSTAIDNTDRFPFLSPAGELAPTIPGKTQYATQVIDGGYFENEGVEIALDLAAALQNISLKGIRVEPIIVQATADAELDVEETRIVRCNDVFFDRPGISLGRPRSSQFLAPLIGLNSVRSGHSNVALRDARASYCAPGKKAFFHFYLYADSSHRVPLNWTLSRYIADYIWDDVITKNGNREELKTLRQLLPPAPKTGTVSAL